MRDGLGTDVVLDGERYSVFRDERDGLQFRKLDDLPISRHEGGIVSHIWEHGFASGMGYGRHDPRNPIDTYAFTSGIDCHRPGVMRLAGRRVSVTPDNPSANVRTDFWETTPAGQAEFFTGSFAKVSSASSDTQDVTHGLSVAPKAIIFWTAGATSGTVIAGGRNCIGMTDGTTERAESWNSEDNVGTSNAASSWRDASIALIDASGAGSEPTAAISAITTSQFTLTWTNNDTGVELIHFLAIGGESVQADVTEWTANTSTGVQEITGVGFEPQAVFHIGGFRGSVGVSTAGAFPGFGVMDGTGNQWIATATSFDGQGTTITNRYQRTDKCIALVGGADSVSHEAAMSSMGADGFSVNWTDAPSAAWLHASLSLKGLQVKAGAFDKIASTQNEAAQTIGFTTEAFLLASVGGDSSTSTQSHASLSLGAATATNEVEASAWTDEDAQATTDSYSVDDAALAFEILDFTDGSEDDVATCGDIDMEQAGWLDWSASPTANEYQICYVALAAGESDVTFVNALNGQRHFKLNAGDSGDAITVESIFDFGNDASGGYGTLFKTEYYAPLGKSTNAQKQTTVAGAGVGDDTWSDAGSAAVAFTTQQDGPTAKIAKGFADSATDPAYKVALSSDGSTYAAGWEIGDTSDEIVRMADSGTSLYIGKERNLFRADPTQIAYKITAEREASATHGTGTRAAQGTDVVFYNHGATQYFFDGASRPRDMGVNSNPWNQDIDELSHVPTGGSYLEGDLHGDWKYDLYAVTESGSTKTYLIVSKMVQGRWVQHSYDRIDGWARGCFLDSSFRLWIATNGKFEYWQFGDDGGPDPGRDEIGFGAASTTYYWYGPEIDLGLEVTTKRLYQFFIYTRNVDATCPVQLIVHRDGGAEENVGATITGNGLSKRYWTNGTNDTATKPRLGLKIVTTSQYAPATSDPQIFVVGVRAYSEPDVSPRYQIVIDTGKEYQEGAGVPPEAITQRDALQALKYADAVSASDPDGNTLTLRVVNVSDAEMRGPVTGPDGDIGVHYVIQVEAEERVTP